LASGNAASELASSSEKKKKEKKDTVTRASCMQSIHLTGKGTVRDSVLDTERS
jgi:hypothetical protein